LLSKVKLVIVNAWISHRFNKNKNRTTNEKYTDKCASFNRTKC
jgi:hypothetical protein